MSAFVAAFPDLHSTLEDLVTERDIVAGRMTTTGTHQGEFMGIPATNKKVTFLRCTSYAYSTAKRWTIGG